MAKEECLTMNNSTLKRYSQHGNLSCSSALDSCERIILSFRKSNPCGFYILRKMKHISHIKCM